MKFGIFVTGDVVERWQANCLDQLLAIPGFSLCTAVVDQTEAASIGSADSSTVLDEGTLALRMLRSKTQSIGSIEARQPVDLEDYLPNASAIRVVGKSGITSEDIIYIRSLGLDFMLDFRPQSCDRLAVDVATLGTWRFRFGDSGNNDNDLPLVAEFIARVPTVTIILENTVAGRDQPTVLSWSRLLRPDSTYSYAINRILLSISDLPAQHCRRLLNSGNWTSEPPSASANRLYPATVAAQMILARDAEFQVREKLGLVNYERNAVWGIGLVKAPIDSFLDPDFRPDVHWLSNPNNGDFYADPFGLQTEDGRFVLVERFERETGLGRIVAIAINDDDCPGPEVEALSLPIHMSYPYVFEHNNTQYCSPEIFQSNGAYLFQVGTRPGRWQNVRALIEDLPIVDPTIIHHQGRFWLWATLHRKGASSDSLYLWYAESLLGPWLAHAANPVKIDIASARPGGTPFLHDGALYRPAQNCSISYGGSMVINRVLKLTPTEYWEEPVIERMPDPTWAYPDGFHTLSSFGDMTLIDGKRFLPEVAPLELTFINPPEPEPLERALRSLRSPDWCGSDAQ